jgi:sulfur-carrier protein adenylyltransferase/sulfurtransferase
MTQPFTEEQVQRYARHIILPNIGGAGQRKLLDASVLVIGAGGLGSPVALYLAAAGVGTLGLVDDDEVDLSHLQRQVIHTSDRVGVHKVDSAEESIKAINPDVQVVKYKTRLDAENIMEIIDGYDVIVDGADNFPTRYLLNDASVRLGIPVVSASILGFDGQLSVFQPHEGPCYRCLYPVPPPAELAPSCGANGVLGVLPGTMGLLQATEVIKLVTGSGEPLVGRLLLYEALGATFTELKVRRDPECPICSRDPEDIADEEMGVFPDYEAFCAAAG